MRLLTISGSLRSSSYNSALLGAAAAAAPGGVDVERLTGLATLPAYDEDLDGGAPPEPIRALREAIERADAILIATPEYNGTIPGHLKTAIDWASRPLGRGALAGKPVAVIGASTGSFGGVWAQEDARKALRIAGARVLDEGVAVPHADRGGVHSETVARRLQRLMAALLAEAREDRAAA